MRVIKRVYFILSIFTLLSVFLFLSFENDVQASQKYPKKAFVSSTVASPQVSVTQTELYLNKSLTKKWYDKMNATSNKVTIGKYLVTLVEYKHIGPIVATMFFGTDMINNDVKKDLKKAIDAKKGVRVTRIFTSGRGQYMSINMPLVSKWDGKRSSIKSHYKNKYYKVKVTKKITN